MKYVHFSYMVTLAIPIAKVDAGALSATFPSACVFHSAKVYPVFVMVPLSSTVTVKVCE